MTIPDPLVYLSGLLVLLVLLVLYGVLGGTYDVGKIVEGADRRASSSKLQFLLWTVVVIYAYVTVYVARLNRGVYLPVDEVPVQLLTAMGLSIVTATAAKGITVGYVTTGRLEKPEAPEDPNRPGKAAPGVKGASLRMMKATRTSRRSRCLPGPSSLSASTS